MTENKKIDPELWAALPSSKKYEYWKTFPHTGYITRCGLTPSGMIYLYKEPLAIPEEWLSITKKMDELNYMDRIIQPRICIDDSVPNGYARIGDQCFELPGAQTYTSNIESDVLGAICGSCTTTFIGTKKAQSEIGLSSGEQRLIKKGLKVKNKIPVNIHDAQTCTSEECKPFDIEELKSLFNTWDKLEADIVNGNYCLKLREEMCKESMIKKIKDDMELRLKDVDKREIRQLWWKLYKSQRIP